MKLQVAKRMESYEQGIFQVLNEQMMELKKSGMKMYNLFVGTPDFSPSKAVMEAVSKAALEPTNYKYALNDLPELIEAFQAYYKRRFQVSLQKEEFMSLYGSQEGMAHIGLSLFNEGDIVLVPNPGYPIFTIGPSLSNATLYEYCLTEENGYLPNLTEISDEIISKTKAIILSYPLNPICKTAPRSFYEKIVAWALEKNIIILHDNAYADIVYDGAIGESILSIPRAMECCVEFYSLSKTFNFTGARVSFLAGNETIIKNFKKLRSQIDYGTFLPVQYGAIAALKTPQSEIDEQCIAYEKRRNTLCSGLSQIGWSIEASQGTMFAWAKIPSVYGDDDITFVLELMKRSGVVCTPGSSFGSMGKGFVRFAFTISCKEIEQAIESIRSCGILTN